MNLKITYFKNIFYLFILLSTIQITGCIPIPILRKVTIRPEGSITVIDTHSKKPLFNVTVVMKRVRIGPPPSEVSHQWIYKTDSTGTVKITPLKGKEWVFPLMMHGVSQWGWSVCTEYQEYKDTCIKWFVEPAWQAKEKLKAPSSIILEIFPLKK